MFVDSTTITLNAGNGGNGVVAWRREKYIPKGGPSGGNGGNGGCIYLRTDSSVLSLESFRNRRLIQADHGHPGGSNLKQGRTGKDLILKIPPGTLVKNAKTKEVLLDCTETNQQWLLCKGGRGGKGNNCFKSSTNQAPNICTPGTKGESFEIEFELKLIADVGFIGMPNAGKSTLLSQITHADVKIGAYPFTTLHPNLSYIQFDDFSRVLVADIPGIIKDAHIDRGLGLAFLRHIERTTVLVFLIDIAAQDGRDPVEDFLTLREELGAYQKGLLEKPFLVALNKIDEENAKEKVDQFREAAHGLDPSTLFAISAKEGIGLTSFIEAVRKQAQALGKHF